MVDNFFKLNVTALLKYIYIRTLQFFLFYFNSPFSKEKVHPQIIPISK